MKRYNSILVCFTGIDGSGKTTLAKTVVKELRAKYGVNAVYIYGRIVPIISRIGVFAIRHVIMKRASNSSKSNYSEYSARKKKLLKNPLVRSLFEISFIVEQIIQVLLKILPRMLVSDIIICDRYIYDTLVTDLGANLKYSPERLKRRLRLFEKFTPKPSLVFFVDVPEEVAISRKNDIPGIEYLRERRELYLHLIKEVSNIVVLDGTQSQNFLKNKIIEHLTERGLLYECQ